MSLRIILRGIGNSWEDETVRLLKILGYDFPTIRPDTDGYNKVIAGTGRKGCEKDYKKIYKKLSPALVDGGIISVEYTMFSKEKTSKKVLNE